MPGRTVVVAVDASDHSRGAFDWYMNEVHRPDDYIVVSHVMGIPHLPNFCLKDGLPSLPTEEWQKTITDSIQRVQKMEQDYEVDLIAKKLKYKTRFETAKEPGPGIMAIAESENANLIVMGTRGLDVIRRTLLGSVSDYVVRHSKVPVLVCPLSGSS